MGEFPTQANIADSIDNPRRFALENVALFPRGKDGRRPRERLEQQPGRLRSHPLWWEFRLRFESSFPVRFSRFSCCKRWWPGHSRHNKRQLQMPASENERNNI